MNGPPRWIFLVRTKLKPIGRLHLRSGHPKHLRNDPMFLTGRRAQIRIPNQWARNGGVVSVANDGMESEAVDDTESDDVEYTESDGFSDGFDDTNSEITDDTDLESLSDTEPEPLEDLRDLRKLGAKYRTPKQTSRTSKCRQTSAGNSRQAGKSEASKGKARAARKSPKRTLSHRRDSTSEDVDLVSDDSCSSSDEPSPRTSRIMSRSGGKGHRRTESAGTTKTLDVNDSGCGGPSHRNRRGASASASRSLPGTNKRGNRKHGKEKKTGGSMKRSNGHV
ncbi:hypothetical protein LTS07_003004 [Exophiala sideris]|uniref:Uncharacterized protein n=1 Tax=Exophiala sideris TaxID=1016849 RepID=A0ABR0JJK5_9EURO|nr:hypothetical protein LTS07_003004 [Exophiala sideris]KAK5042380.1 hypothetical protein LTR13_001227 [Exophiala sideris]KAK5065461.1 hypothetical protein LTR69_003010 [Exophiala sideris]KAK5186079.1 hypothetical protein LTR44_002128 [Eurotiomycetes sp. CCFEE 6388]